MPNFLKRSYEQELMDDLSLNTDDLRKNLDEIDTINRVLGGNEITIKCVEKLIEMFPSNRELTIVDLGCGSGTLLTLVSKVIKKRGLKVKCLGVDANPYIIEYAKQKNKLFHDVNFQTLNIFSPEFKELKADIFVATLFFHHFTEEQLIPVLNTIYHNSAMGLVVNDLERNALAYYGIEVLTNLFSRSPLTKNDAKLSVLRGFSRVELQSIMHQSEWKSYRLRWRWAFRWAIIAKK